MSKVSNKKTTWHLVNIKARRNQTTEHYVQAIEKLYHDDPLICFPRGGKSGSLKHVSFSEIKDETGNPNWIQIELLSYTIVDPEAFYSKSRREDVIIDNWNEDIVANKKETVLYFIPSVHTLAVRCNSVISLNNVVFYLSKALNIIEPEAFDVDVIKERDILDKILNAYAVTQIYANISYSNHGHSDGFEEAFDNKLREMGANRIEFTATGSKRNPLNNDKDGMLQSIINLSEHNGYVRATIQSAEDSKLEKIDSNEHPRILVIPQIVNNICTTIYNTIKGIFN